MPFFSPFGGSKKRDTQEQANSYDLMAQAAGNAAKGADIAAIGSFIAGGIAAIAAIA
jgi:hypothetical protein